ncbi:MAG: glycosyltransferase [Terrimonas sp.]|nr:glycosyltransferase [Terrimonas sp.]
MESSKTENPAKKILLANFPADGHFNPLTGIAVHLSNLGYDVRWYCSEGYAPKLKKLQIHHYPFKKAIDVSDGNFDKMFPGRQQYRTAVGKLRFDIIHAFILRAPEYYTDILDIYREFPFELIIADCAFTALPFVKELMKIPVLAIGVLPLTASSKDLPPSGLGMEPSYTFTGRMKQAAMRYLADRIIFKKPNRVMHQMLDQYGIPHDHESVFDMMIRKSDFLLQSGTPGFEYKRSDLGSNIQFIGALLPYRSATTKSQWFDNRVSCYRKIVLVTQGTVEKDIEKLIIPTLEAFKNSDTLVICTTGGSQTDFLRAKYPSPNIIIEDYIPFNDVMPYAGVYITNGGYGGVMLGIENELPMVVAGSHEGKNEINARVGYFGLGINLKTEKPSAVQIRQAVNQVLQDSRYREQVKKLAAEFREYRPEEMVAAYVKEILFGSVISKAA